MAGKGELLQGIHAPQVETPGHAGKLSKGLRLLCCVLSPPCEPSGDGFLHGVVVALGFIQLVQVRARRKVLGTFRAVEKLLELDDTHGTQRLVDVHRLAEELLHRGSAHLRDAAGFRQRDAKAAGPL